MPAISRRLLRRMLSDSLYVTLKTRLYERRIASLQPASFDELSTQGQAATDFFSFHNFIEDLNQRKMIPRLAVSLLSQHVGRANFLERIFSALKSTKNPDKEVLNFFKLQTQDYRTDEWKNMLINSDNMHPSSDSLQKYYNSIITCAFTWPRLFDFDWVYYRAVQFLFIQKEMRGEIYLEDGGSDGLMPILAAAIFNKSINCELSDASGKLSQQIATALDFRNFSRISNLDNIEDASVAVLSSHQVLEHLPNPNKQISMYYRKLRPGGLLFLSTGFCQQLYPGHLPSNQRFCGREREIVEAEGFKMNEFTDLLFARVKTLFYTKPQMS